MKTKEGHEDEVWRVSEPSFLSSLKQNKNFVILSCTCQNLIKPQDVDFRSRQPNTEQTLTWSLDTSQKVWIKLIKCKGYLVTLVQTSSEISWDWISFRVAQRLYTSEGTVHCYLIDYPESTHRQYLVSTFQSGELSVFGKLVEWPLIKPEQMFVGGITICVPSHRSPGTRRRQIWSWKYIHTTTSVITPILMSGVPLTKLITN